MKTSKKSKQNEMENCNTYIKQHITKIQGRPNLMKYQAKLTMEVSWLPFFRIISENIIKRYIIHIVMNNI